MRAPFGLIPLMILAWVATACGGSDQQGESQESAATESETSTSLEELDACTLLTAEEIQAATGQAPGAGSDPMSTPAAAPMCVWPSADGAIHQVVQVLVSYANYDTFEEYRQAMAAEGIAQLTQIEGPGRYTVDLGELEMLQAHGERFMVQIMVEPAAGIDRVAAATTLARAALERVE